MFERCVRCGAPSAIRMCFDYGARTVWLDDIVERIRSGAGWPMCDDHADRLTPPVGWDLIDRRGPERRLFTSLEVA
jgi:hypothetical protein